MSGAHSRNKGYRFEAETVNYLKERGLKAVRVPLSGATTHTKNDLEVIANFDGKTKYSGECKRTKSLPKFFTDALDGADFAAFRQDRGETLVVLRLDTFADLLQ
jgi:Holliday junction resolvase